MNKTFGLAIVLIVVSAALTGCSDGGAGGVAVHIIAAEGGSMTSTDGKLTLEIPPGALADDTEVRIRAVEADDLPAELAALGVGGGYELTPEGLTFSEPMTVSLAVDAASLAAEEGEGYQVVGLFSWSEEHGLQPLEAHVLEISLTEEQALLQGELDHFSHLIYTKHGMTISASDIQRALVGERFGVLVNIENTAAAVVRVQYGAYAAFNQVELVGDDRFAPPPIEFGGSWSSGTVFKCKEQPGSGTYNVYVKAEIEEEGFYEGGTHLVYVPLNGEVDCVEPTPVPEQPVGDTPTEEPSEPGDEPDAAPEEGLASDPAGDEFDCDTNEPRTDPHADITQVDIRIMDFNNMAHIEIIVALAETGELGYMFSAIVEFPEFNSFIGYSWVDGQSLTAPLDPDTGAPLLGTAWGEYVANDGQVTIRIPISFFQEPPEMARIRTMNLEPDPDVRTCDSIEIDFRLDW